MVLLRLPKNDRISKKSVEANVRASGIRESGPVSVKEIACSCKEYESENKRLSRGFIIKSPVSA